MDGSQPSTKDERSLESKARAVQDASVTDGSQARGPLVYDRSGGSRSNFDVKVFTNNNISGNLVEGQNVA